MNLLTVGLINRFLKAALKLISLTIQTELLSNEERATLLSY